MDVDGFRKPTSPFFYTQPPTYLVEVTTARVALPPAKTTLPTQDSRFPGWAAPMSDGRFITDYRAHCETSIPSHQSYAVRHWMQRKGSELIATARTRQAATVGAGLPRAQTECPPQSVLLCDTQMCGRRAVDPAGVGEARVEPVPPLFGTYEPSATRIFASPGPALTTRFEGGRNTPRGTY